MEQTQKVLRSAFDSPTFGEDASFRLDKPVGSASISPCGRDIVLASRLGLHIIDLDSPYSPPRHLPHQTPWEVADVQWSPFAARDSWVVSTSNQKALLWNLDMRNTRSSIEHVLHAHTRAITDINFSAHHLDILATCAVDSFVHCWDIRYPARPAISFCDWFAGATQVKWNRQDSHILASSHDKFLRIWDDRKGAYPLRSIEAHVTKIYGVDWDRAEPRNLVTCSLDRTIKFWDYTDEAKEPQMIINTPFPVWRARHTPFGYGLLAMPQRGDHDLHLYDRRQSGDIQHGDTHSPVHSFEGHGDQVKEFLWRPRGTIAEDIDSREFQLVSWGSDKVLRLHQVNEEVLESVGYRKGVKAMPRTNLTRRNAIYKTYREDSSEQPYPGFGHSESSFPIQPRFRRTSSMGMSKGPGIERGLGGAGQTRSMAVTKKKGKIDMDPISWMKGVKIGKRTTSPLGIHRSLSSVLSPHLASDRIWERFDSLGEEITYVGQKYDKITFDEIDMLNRITVFSLSGPWGPAGTSSWMKLCIMFPDDYPEVARPQFTVKESPNIADQLIQQIFNGVDCIFEAYLECQRSSLEAVLLYLIGDRDLEQSLLWLKTRLKTENDVPQNSAESSSDEDDRLDSDDKLTASNTQYNVPLPKACGALWADDGRLVCFFPHRQEKATSSFVDGLSLKLTSQKGMFEGFGRLNQDFPGSKRPPTTTTSGSGESDFEDISSSSDSSTSSDGMIAPGQLFWPSGILDGLHDQSIDGMHRSLGAMDESTTQSGGNYISIHDCQDLLPSKQDLAHEYILSSDQQQCCAHNSLVAAKCGAYELADVWSLVELILKKDVPLDILKPNNDETILVAARRAVHPSSTNDSAIDLSYDTAGGVQECATVKWGGHPFGNRWLVNSIFQYFESLADTQMLAMLSCVLSKPSPNSDDLPQPQCHWDDSVHDTSNAFGTYFPPEVAHEMLDSQLVGPRLRPDYANKPVKRSRDSFNSVPQDTLTAHSLIPPLSYKQRLAGFDRRDSDSTRFSTSPEQLRHEPRLNSNLASAFAASLSRPFSFNSSASSSPPSNYKKRLSPAGSYIESPSGVGWGTSGLFSKASTRANAPKHGHSVSVSEMEDEEGPVRAPVFVTKLKNQQQFPNEGYADVPLLDPAKEWLYRAYREAYANILFSWNMPIAMCEVLKYNKAELQDDDEPAEGPLAIGKTTTEGDGLGSRESLTMRNHDEKEEESCPSGCGCHCSEYAVIEVQESEHEIRNDSTGVFAVTADGKYLASWQGQAGGDGEHAWQDVVYESLARNLGSRTVTPKSSQIWRGGLNDHPKNRKQSGGSNLRNEESLG